MAVIGMVERQILEQAFALGSGYVLNFSDRSFAEFFESELGIDINDPRYGERGVSKGKRLRQFLTVENERTVAKALRALWEYRRVSYASAENTTRAMTSGVLDIIARLEGVANHAETDAIERFADDMTLDELVAAIRRDIDADRPQAALDRLHTYCMKKFAHLLRTHGMEVEGNTLDGRAGRFFNELRRTGRIRPISNKIMKRAVEVFGLYQGIRNNESFAHDNEIVDAAEARFIFDSVHAILRFLKSIEADSFGA